MSGPGDTLAFPPEPQPIPDDEFMENVRESRENGHDVLCALCGAGLYDESDAHARGCPLYVPWRPE